MPTLSFSITDKCSGVIRTPGVAITTLDGRLQGQQVTFDTISYEEYKMRRKAEALKFRPVVQSNKTYKSGYSVIAQNGGQYSQFNLRKIANATAVDCPIISYPATNSGVRAEYKMKYYYNPNINYYTSL
jgi:hypothetical protein